MAKKRNYENDEAYKNFRVEDFLPEMKWRVRWVRNCMQLWRI